MAPFRRPRLAAPTPESTAWTLLSTWAQQRHLPPINPSLNGEQVRKGTILGKFELTRKLGGGPCANPARHLFLPVDAPAGEGEFAQVYECVKREDRARRFACKAIRKERMQRHASLHKAKRNIKRVDTEVRALKRFSHAAVVRLCDVIQSPAHVYLILERGDQDLYAFLDDYKDGCTEDVVRSVIRITTLGLRHCHRQGIAHRDVKPENVLVMGAPGDWATIEAQRDPAQRGVVKLCDFGLCADVSSGEHLTDFVGSPGFIAPELLLAKSYDGKRADVWSLGCVMLEMLLGHEVFTNLWCPPYDHLHDDEAFRDAVGETVLQVKLGSTQCAPSPALRMLVEQLLELDPARRATIDQLCEATYFDLLLKEGGQHKLLRLTYDSTRRSFSDKPVAERRKTGRRKRVTLSRIDSEGAVEQPPSPSRNLKIQTRIDLSQPREPNSPMPLNALAGLADAPTRPPSFDAGPPATAAVAARVA